MFEATGGMMSIVYVLVEKRQTRLVFIMGVYKRKELADSTAELLMQTRDELSVHYEVVEKPLEE